MQFSNKFKVTWWIILILIGSLLLYLQWHDFARNHPTTFDTVLLGIVAALLLIPLFSEISFLGVSVKQSIEKVKEEIAGLKNEISNRIEFNPQIQVGFDDRAIRERVTQVMRDMGIQPVSHERDVFNAQVTGTVPQNNLDVCLQHALRLRVNLSASIALGIMIPKGTRLITG